MNFLTKEEANFVFHSVKIEGSSLTRGETDALLDGSKRPKSRQQLEPINVKNAYEFCLENSEYIEKTPESFIRQLHGMVLRDIESDGGQYRKEQVTISGMTYAPPDWADVEPFMGRLGGELKKLDPQKTAIQNAAEMHSKFTSIHPFRDRERQNGKTYHERHPAKCGTTCDCDCAFRQSSLS